jgi:hypothetical protein
LTLYREVIAKHRQGKSVEDLIRDTAFVRLVYRTLEAWNMNQRGARLTSVENLQASLQEHQAELTELYQYDILSMEYGDFEKILDLLERVFCSLHVMESKRKIVGVSKALHFLVPDLLMPIDSKFTLPGFFGENVYSPLPLAELAVYKDILLRSYQVLKKLNITDEDITGEQWNTSAPKLIDNALIGIYKYIDQCGTEKFKETLQTLSSS